MVIQTVRFLLNDMQKSPIYMIGYDHELITYCTHITRIHKETRSVATCLHRLRGQVCRTLLQQFINLTFSI